MATLDSSIPLQVRQPKIISPEEAQVRGLNIRSLVRGEQQAQQQQKEQQTIRDLWRQSTGENGELDAAAFDRGVASAGLGDRLPDIRKDRAALGKTQADTQAAQFQLAKQKMDAVAGGLSALLANPQVTHADVNAQLNNLVNAGVITAEQGAQAARGLPGRPEQLRPFLIQQALQAAEGSKRLESLLPKYDEQDRGGTINQGTVNQLTGQRTETGSIPKTATPGEQLTDARVRGGFGDQGGKPPAGYRFKADGSLEYIPGGPADPAIASSNKNLRPIPSAAASGIIGNRSSMAKIDAAIAAVEANKEAFGLKNYLGDEIRQRTDPGGVDPRAKVADIGSLQIHDRSGAAVTASETPRLKPFVPMATDDADTILVKLKNLKANYASQVDEAEAFYSPESGYRPIGGGQATPANLGPTAPRPSLDAIFGGR